jgi:uncharacterized protein (TIGR03000 family)
MQALTGGPAYATPRPTANTAVIMVILPPSSQLLINGQPTYLTGAVRCFYTQPLIVNQTYTYRLRVEWVREGHACVAERDIQFRAGELTRQYFRLPLPDQRSP